MLKCGRLERNRVERNYVTSAIMPSPVVAVAALLTLLLFLVEAFLPGKLAIATKTLPTGLRLFSPAVLCVPYLLVASSSGTFHWGWLALYALLPVAIAILMWHAAQIDPDQHGNWRDFLVLSILGLAVDLRWFEHAWPPNLVVFNKMLLLDAGIYGLLVIRRIGGVGFDLRLRLRDLAIGLREFAFYAPIAIPVGLSIGFLQLHASSPSLPRLGGAFLFTFFFIAVPEELFFRGWLQNLVERRLGPSPALLVTAVLFGLSHWNKRALHFNWRYVLMATSGGNLLRARVASAAPRGGIFDRPCLCRYRMVLLAALMMMVARRTVGKVTKSDPHIVVHRTRNRDSDADAEDDMHRGQCVEVAI